MYSEENEKLAEKAYALFRAQYPNEPEWAALPNKARWRDLVNEWQRVDAAPANAIEECVQAAVYPPAEEAPKAKAKPAPKAEDKPAAKK